MMRRGGHGLQRLATVVEQERSDDQVARRVPEPPHPPELDRTTAQGCTSRRQRLATPIVALTIVLRPAARTVRPRTSFSRSSDG